MHKRKNKFNAIVLKNSTIKPVLSVIIYLMLIFSFSSAIHQLPLISLKYILRSQIPAIQNSVIKENFKAHICDFFNLQQVLADSLPMINHQKQIQPIPKTNIEEKISPIIPEFSIPENTLPIKSTQTIGKNLELRNETTYTPDIYSLLYAPLNFKSPEILIVHTHASESYKMDELDYYKKTDSDRNIDPEFNTVKVGEELAKELRKFGFQVTHAKDINDHPSYNQSYNKTLEVINYHLRNNENIKIVFDIHRDSIVKDDGSKLKFVSDINGEKAAQVMLVCGTNQLGLENDNWQENLKFALKLQNYMETTYPGLARPLNLRQERFNTHATQGSMIIEVGTSGNTLKEAITSTKFLATSIAYVLKPYQ